MSEETIVDETVTDETSTGTGSKPKPEDELPEWARKELTNVRGEAANYRVKNRELQEALKKAKTPEEFEAVTAEHATKVAALELDVVKLRVATKNKLPDELAARLKGANEAELDADAKALAKLITPAPTKVVTLKGGLTPDSEDDGEMDPRKLAKMYRR